MFSVSCVTISRTLQGCCLWLWKKCILSLYQYLLLSVCLRVWWTENLSWMCSFLSDHVCCQWPRCHQKDCTLVSLLWAAHFSLLFQIIRSVYLSCAMWSIFKRVCKNMIYMILCNMKKEKNDCWVWTCGVDYCVCCVFRLSGKNV